MRRAQGSITDLGQVKGSVHRWLIQVSAGKSGGKRVRKTKRVTGTRKAAEDALQCLLDQTSTYRASVKVADFFDGEYLDHCRLKQLSPTTIEGYKRNFRNHIAPAIGDMTLGEVSPSDISRLLGSLTAGSARHVKAALSSIFSYAEELELVETSVMRRKYTLPKAEARHHDQRVLTYGELADIAQAAAGERWEAVFICMAFGGLRRSEAAALQPWDISFRKDSNGGEWAVLRLARTLVMVDGKPTVRDVMKTENSAREALVGQPWASRLKELQRQRMDAGDVWMTGDLWNPDTMSCAYDRWFQGQPYVRVPMKNLRNSYATWMISSGVDMGIVGKLMGHTQVGTTYKHYLRPGVDDAISYLAALDAPEPGGDAIKAAN